MYYICSYDKQFLIMYKQIWKYQLETADWLELETQLNVIQLSRESILILINYWMVDWYSMCLSGFLHKA
jgi:hypothetical protein